MARSFIVIFILLVTLAIIYTIPIHKINTIPIHKRKSLNLFGFGPCPGVANTFSVTMDPNPLISRHIVTFTLNGELTTNQIIEPFSSVVVTIGATVPVQSNPNSFLFCDSTDCPVYPDTNYTVKGSIALEGVLPQSYEIILQIGIINSSSPTMSFLHDEVVACAIAYI